MALTITYDGFGVVANADGITDSAGGTWDELGGGTITLNPDVYLYGAASIGSKYASKSGFTYFTATTALDMSVGGTEEGQYIYMWINIQSASAFDTLANDGFHAVVGSDTNNYYKFPIVGSDEANGWAGGWKLFVLDISLGITVGTPVLTAIDTFGVWIDTIVSVRADSIFQSQIMCANGLKVEGTSSVMYDDIVLWAEDYANRAAGMFQSRGQTYFSLGSLSVHSDTANTVVSSSGNNVEYEKSEHHNGTTWVTSYPTDANLITVASTSTNTTDMTDTNVGLSGNDSNRVAIDSSAANSFKKLGGSIKYLSTMSSTASDEYSGVVFSLYNARTLGVEPYANCTFDGSASLTLTATSDFTTSNIVNGTTGIHSLITPELSYVASSVLNSSGSNHGVELTTIGTGAMTWNCVTTGFDTGTAASPVTPTATGNEDIYVTATTGTVTINVSDGATTPSIRSAGAVVNVIAGQITLTLTGLIDGIEVRIRQGSYTLQHTQNVTGGQVTYTYSYIQDELVTISFGGAGIIQAKTIQLTLGNANQTSLITFVNDPSYIDDITYDIQYTSTFVYDVNATDQAILVNQGTGGTADALLKTGRAIELGATNNLAFTVGTKYITWFDFATNEFLTQTGDKTFNTVTINNILISTAVVSAADILVLNANPELMGKLSLSGTGTIPELDITLVATDEYYMGMEATGRKVIDSRHIGVSNAEVTGWTSLTDGTGNTCTNVDNVFTIHNVVTATTSYFPLIRAEHTYILDELYIIMITVAVSNGTFKGNFIYEDFNNLDQALGFLVTSGETVTQSTVGNFTDNGRIQCSPDDTTYPVFDAIITYDIKAATAQEITNYADSVRLNVDYNENGIQTTAFITDEYVPTEYIDTYIVQNDKQTITLPLDTPLDYTPTKDIKKIEGDSTELTITHTDLTTVVVP